MAGLAELIRPRLLGALQGAQATCADMHPTRLPINHQGHLLNIGRPLPVRRHLRVADIVPELRALAADLTARHDHTSIAQAPWPVICLQADGHITII
jgi:hypothetical protein